MRKNEKERKKERELERKKDIFINLILTII